MWFIALANKQWKNSVQHTGHDNCSSRCAFGFFGVWSMVQSCQLITNKSVYYTMCRETMKGQNQHLWLGRNRPHSMGLWYIYMILWFRNRFDAGSNPQHPELSMPAGKKKSLGLSTWRSDFVDHVLNKHSRKEHDRDLQTNKKIKKTALCI